jgi:two-component system, NarL family, invasion response regulator UvrY
MIAVLLVDDHAVVREGYRRLLEGDAELMVVGEAATSSQALRMDRELAPDVIVLDIALPDVSGIETLRRIIARRPAARVLIFSMYEDAIYVSRALDGGALGYMTKASAAEHLPRAVRQVAGGTRYLSPDVERMIAERSSRRDSAAALSHREHEVLRQLMQGHSVHAIAARLGVSAKTVANYQTSIREKLGVESALQLLVVARDLGLDAH